MHDQLAASYLAAWNTHDGDAVAAFATDDVDFEEVTLGEQLHGRAAVRDFVHRFTQTFSSDYHFTLVGEYTSPDAMTAEWVVAGCHDGDAPGLPATDKPFVIRGATIARLVDGKISHNRDYWDMANFLRQIGVLPTP